MASALLASAFLLSSCSDITETPITPDQGLDQQKLGFIQPEGELVKFPGILGTDLDVNSRGKGSEKNRFNITIVYQNPFGLFLDPTERQIEVFQNAVDRWEKIIIKDVPSITVPEGEFLPSAFGFPNFPLLNAGETVDDIIIEVFFDNIDGEGGILGAASPVLVRNTDFLTLSGFMRFDVADLDALDQDGQLDEVIVHEIGHILGIGTLWDFEREFLKFNPEGFPYFDGKVGNQFWKNEGGDDFLPIQFIGGPGSAFSHWDELELRNELMTGFLNAGENPLSRITAASLRDLGYGTSMAAEKYDLPAEAEGVAARTNENGIDIASREQLGKPYGIVVVK
jgi:hypothetical protein